MKPQCLLLAMMLLPFSVHAAGTDSAPPQALEVSIFYGEAKSILKRLSSLDAQFPDHTLYMVAVDDMNSASFRLFARNNKAEEDVSVFDWSGRSTAGLQQAADSLLREGQSKACAQRAMVSVLTKQAPLEEMGAIPAPVSTWAAFAHVIKEYAGRHIRVAIYLLC
jgi:hypothetical protein